MKWVRSTKQVFSAFTSKTFDAKKMFCVSLILTIIGIFFNILSPFLFNAAIIAIITKRTVQYFGITLSSIEIVGCFCVVWSMVKIIPKFRNMAINRLVIDSTHYLLYRLFKAFMCLPFNYHATVPMGRNTELLKLCYNNSEEFTYLLLSEIIPTFLELLVAASILSYLYGFTMSCTLLAIVTLYSIYNIISVRWTDRARRECVSCMVKAQEKIVGTIANYETVHIFNNLPSELESVKDELKKLSKYANRSINKQDLVSTGRAVFVSIAFSAILFYIALQSDFGKTHKGTLLFLVYYLGQFSIPLINFGEAINKSHGALLGLEHVTQLLEEQEILEKASSAKNKPNIGKDLSISFENVSFSYDPNKKILSDINFKIAPGQKVAVVGKSGSGKSTIVKLLIRYYDLEPKANGHIYIGPHDINDLDINVLRSKLSLVPQCPVLFNNTLRYNLSYGTSSLSDDQLWQALEELELADYFRSTKTQLDTLVGERGLKISGGQLQRIAIARALLKDPLLLILDEATSGLDPDTEEKIQKNIDKITKNISTLVISHRLNTIKTADCILVLREGVIVEQGTHEKLLQQGGEYHNLWNAYEKNNAANETARIN